MLGILLTWSLAYLSRRNSASSLARLKPKHSIKFLHLVKTLPMFTLVLPNCLSLCILASLFTKYTEHFGLHFCTEIQKNTLLVVWRYASILVDRQVGHPIRFSTSITKMFMKNIASPCFKVGLNTNNLTTLLNVMFGKSQNEFIHFVVGMSKST